MSADTMDMDNTRESLLERSIHDTSTCVRSMDIRGDTYLEHIMRAIASIYVITYVSGSYGQLSTQYDNNTRAKLSPD
jgi:hypothetical protein